MKRKQQVGISPIVVITGCEAEEIERHLADYGVVFLRNEQYQNAQMFDCAKDGCSEGACGTCTVLVDGKAVKACVQKISKFLGKKKFMNIVLQKQVPFSVAFAFRV